MYKPSCVNPVSCGKINEYEAGEMSTPSRQNGRNSGNPRPGAVKIKKGAVSLAQINLETLDRILKAHDYDPTLVIGIMQDIQKEYHYLPQDALIYTAKKLGISEAKIYGVATFYENFSLEPKGKYIIKICDGTACHVRKSVPILEEIRSILGVT